MGLRGPGAYSLSQRLRDMQRMGMVPPPKKIICPTCGKPIEPEKRRGRPRRFHPGCSPFEPRKPAQ